MKLGITCYPSLGGSGIVATEIGLGMARRGHEVHFICSSHPARLPRDAPRVHVHLVRKRDYPVFPEVPAALAQVSAIVEATREHSLDLVHAHYAVPHATSAWMAREVLGGALGVVTTLHGTDVTLVGSDPAYLPITRHSIEVSDRVTAPSQFLANDTHDRFETTKPIEVIANFVDGEHYRPLAGERSRICELFGDDREPVMVHVSNFRPLKRVDRVVEAFAKVHAEVPCRLLLVGDGPCKADAEQRVAAHGLGEKVRMVGSMAEVAALVRECAVFVLPSETESFGLAALEALASGVPVVAMRVGGLPEVVRDGETGFLVEDEEELAARLLSLMRSPGDRKQMGRAAREDALARFQREPLLDRYEALYQSL